MYIDDVFYFFLSFEYNFIVRLYVLVYYRFMVLKFYYDDYCYFGFDKIFDFIREKYYWLNLYKEIYDYVSKCIICFLRNFKKFKLFM